WDCRSSRPRRKNARTRPCARASEPARRGPNSFRISADAATRGGVSMTMTDSGRAFDAPRDGFATPEELLAHAGWVRALARELVRDASTADDLVQETWLAALRHPPRAGSSMRPA